LLLQTNRCTDAPRTNATTATRSRSRPPPPPHQAYVQAAIIAFFIVAAFTNMNELSGFGASNWELGTTAMIAVVVVANVRLNFEAKSWTVRYCSMWLLTILATILTVIWFNGKSFLKFLNGAMFGQLAMLSASPTFWSVLAACTHAVLLLFTAAVAAVLVLLQCSSFASVFQFFSSARTSHTFLSAVPCGCHPLQPAAGIPWC
jgi:hypothetical protein